MKHFEPGLVEDGLKIQKWLVIARKRLDARATRPQASCSRCSNIVSMVSSSKAILDDMSKKADRGACYQS